jgi:hypothetical protein
MSDPENLAYIRKTKVPLSLGIIWGVLPQENKNKLTLLTGGF